MIIRNEYVELYKKDNILFGKYLTKSLTMEVVNSVMNLQYSNFGYDTELILVDLNTIRNVSKEAREFFSKKDVEHNIKAMAYVSQNIIHTLIFRFFLTFNKPVINMAFFNKKEDAIKWLKSFE